MLKKVFEWTCDGPRHRRCVRKMVVEDQEGVPEGWMPVSDLPSDMPRLPYRYGYLKLPRSGHLCPACRSFALGYLKVKAEIPARQERRLAEAREASALAAERREWTGRFPRLLRGRPRTGIEVTAVDLSRLNEMAEREQRKGIWLPCQNRKVTVGKRFESIQDFAGYFGVSDYHIKKALQTDSPTIHGVSFKAI